MSAATSLPRIYASIVVHGNNSALNCSSFHSCTTSNRDNPGSGCVEIVCQMPVQSKVMFAPADFLAADFKELFTATRINFPS